MGEREVKLVKTVERENTQMFNWGKQHDNNNNNKRFDSEVTGKNMVTGESLRSINSYHKSLLKQL